MFSYVRNKYDLNKEQTKILDLIEETVKIKPENLEPVIDNLNQQVENNFNEKQSEIILKKTSLLVHSSKFWHSLNRAKKDYESDSTSSLQKISNRPPSIVGGYYSDNHLSHRDLNRILSSIVNALRDTQVDNVTVADVGGAGFFSKSLNPYAILGGAAGCSFATWWNMNF